MNSTEPYWLRLEFPAAAVEIVRQALRAKLFRGSLRERVAKLLALNAALSAHYAVPLCRISIRNTPHGPHYMPGRNQIVLDKISIVSYLHEFGHHILNARGLPQNETYPRAFSLGLFYRAAPRMFETARQAGRLLYTENKGDN